jgi:pyrimidine deaminase RibD-like protein
MADRPYESIVDGQLRRHRESVLQKAIRDSRPEPVLSHTGTRSAAAIMIDLLEVVDYHEGAMDDHAERIAALKAEARTFIASGAYD